MGFIDLHSHLLPGIDDGCVSAEESLACVRRLMAHGFVGTVCTPHILPHIYPDNTPTQIQPRVESLRELLRTADLDYQLWAGGEVRIDADTVSWFETMGVPTLGPSKFVLIDYWGDSWPACGDKVVDYLLRHEYRPILAHPERMNFAEDEWEAVLAALTGRSVWLQGNLNSLAGGEGTTARERAWRLLSRGSYHLIASDMHRPNQLDGRVHGIRLLTEEIGEKESDVLLGKRPGEILGWPRD